MPKLSELIFKNLSRLVGYIYVYVYVCMCVHVCVHFIFFYFKCIIKSVRYWIVRTLIMIL